MPLEFQNNPSTSLLMVGAADPEAIGDADPDAGSYRLVMGTDDKLYILDEAGNATEVGAAAGAVATDAIWDAAGDLAVGSGANTAARLALGAAGGALSRVNGAVAWNSGTSFPTAATGDRYWRTDLGMEFYYDGTRWVSTQLFSMTNNLGANTTATAYVPLSATMAPAFFLPSPNKLGGSDIWLVSSRLTFYITGGATALGASHKWVVTTGKVDTANTNTVVATHNIDSGSSAVWREDSQAIGALMNNGTTHYSIYLTPTKTGTPGNIYPELILTYRIVAT